MIGPNHNIETTGHHGGERGFTLVELVVVIAILGVLAAIAVPTLTSYLGSSKAQGYSTELERIQLAVDSYYSDPGNSRYLGLRQYPVLGKLKTEGEYYSGDQDDNGETVTIAGNPLGGTQGGNPRWADDDDGVREDDEEILNDEDSESSDKGWHVASVDRQGTEYFVDSRDYFVDFDELVTAGLLEKAPASASVDNKPSGSSGEYAGSYSYYVDPNGRVKSLYRYFPEPTQTGFQDAFP